MENSLHPPHATLRTPRPKSQIIGPVEKVQEQIAALRKDYDAKINQALGQLKPLQAARETKRKQILSLRAQIRDLNDKIDKWHDAAQQPKPDQLRFLEYRLQKKRLHQKRLEDMRRIRAAAKAESDRIRAEEQQPNQPHQMKTETTTITLNDNRIVVCDIMDHRGRFRVAVASCGYEVGDWIERNPTTKKTPNPDH